MAVRRIRSSVRVGVLAAAVALVTGACAGDPIDGRAISGPPTGTGTAGPRTSTPTTPTGPPTGTLTWGETTTASTNLLPLIADGNSTANANLLVRTLDGLYRSSPGFTFVPDTDQGTATSSTDGSRQVVDIKINDKAVWADGRPITAEDYAFTIDAQKSVDPAKGGCAALLSTFGFDQVERTQTVGDKELKVYFTTPFADWRTMFSGAGGSSPLLAKHVFDKGSATATCAYLTKGWPVADGIPLGAQNGPWLLDAQNIDTAAKTIALVPNPRYWGDKPKLARLVHKSIGADADAAVAALRDGEVDAVYPTPQVDLLSRLQQLTGTTTTVGLGAAFEHLDFNTRDGLLKYPQIRRAIALAVDRSRLVSETVGRFTDRVRPTGNRLVLNSQQGYEDHSGDYARQDVAKARQLIESVGGKRGSDGYYRLGGKPLSFRVMTTQGNPLRDRTITALATQARAAGIKLTEFANPDIFLGADKPTSLAAGKFQIALFAWVGTPALSTSNPIYLNPTKGGGQNYSYGSTPSIDAGLGTVATASTPAGQLASANAVDRLLWDQMYTLPLYQKPTILAYKSSVSGLADNGSQSGPLWNSDDVSVR